MQNKSTASILYRLPDTETIHFINGNLMNEKSVQKSDWMNQSVFVFCPFNSHNIHWIDPIDRQEINQNQWGDTNWDTYFKQSKPNSLPFISTKEEYEVQFKGLMNSFKTEKLQKAILSRITPLPLHSTPVELFHKLCLQYPSAFVYLFHSNEFGMWMGASPERLLQWENKQCKTMSLAGTLPYEETIIWTNKELEEQEIVTQYIRETLNNENIGFWKEKGPFNKKAGKIAHLCTEFNFEHQNNVPNLVKSLHPTPAVCGLPLKQAFRQIEAIEKHDRELYAGFLGPVNNKQGQLFVNLRCMKIVSNEAYLYVGGGITKHSVVEKEWNETILKTSTLKKVIN